MRGKHKGKGSIFRKLLVSYFFFAAAAILILYAGLFAELLLFTDGNIEQFVPAEIVGGDGRLGDLEPVYRMGGWVEHLDGSYGVAEVFGEKQTAAASYTEHELLELTRVDGDGAWVAFWEPVDDSSYLFFYPRETLQVALNFQVNAMELTGPERWIPLLIVLLLIADGVLVSRYIYRNIRRPLQWLSDGMRRVAEGEAEVRLDFITAGEFVEMQQAFNGMTERLEQAQTERERLQRSRQQLLIELSHDLKTPLAAIKSCVSALMEEVVTGEERGRYYQMIAQKTDWVSALADDLFTMLKMESSDYVPEKRMLDFCELVRQICAEYYGELSDFSVEITIPEIPLTVNADRMLLMRTVGNLITNAVRYNRTGSTIRVTVTDSKETVVLSVADDGAPIAEEIRERMFLAFVRGDASRGSDGGTGLGLAIARGVARKHGGDLYYQYGNGENRFVLLLPRGSL